MRGTNGTDANNNTTFDTINAAAFAIASASHNRLSQPPSQVQVTTIKKWVSIIFLLSGCFSRVLLCLQFG